MVAAVMLGCCDAGVERSSMCSLDQLVVVEEGQI